MGIVLLVIHIAAVALFVGPAAIAASMFPGYVPISQGTSQRGRIDRRPRSAAVAVVLHRVSRIYGSLALIVPIAGISLAVLWNKFGQLWLIVAMVLTVVAGVLLVVRIVPEQKRALASPPTGRQLSMLAAGVGIFNLLWLVVLILMVVQPGGKHAA